MASLRDSYLGLLWSTCSACETPAATPGGATRRRRRLYESAPETRVVEDPFSPSAERDRTPRRTRGLGPGGPFPLSVTDAGRKRAFCDAGFSAARLCRRLCVSEAVGGVRQGEQRRRGRDPRATAPGDPKEGRKRPKALHTALRLPTARRTLRRDGCTVRWMPRHKEIGTKVSVSCMRRHSGGTEGQIDFYYHLKGQSKRLRSMKEVRLRLARGRRQTGGALKEAPCRRRYTCGP
jgi:hypothetical protein